MYKYIFSNNDWYKPLSFLNNKIDTYVNSTVNFDIVCTATAIKELCQAREWVTHNSLTDRNLLLLFFCIYIYIYIYISHTFFLYISL